MRRGLFRGGRVAEEDGIRQDLECAQSLIQQEPYPEGKHALMLLEK
jgi:hypothetical protein